MVGGKRWLVSACILVPGFPQGLKQLSLARLSLLPSISPMPYFPEDAVEDENDYEPSPLVSFQRPRSRTMIDVGQSDHLLGNQQMFYLGGLQPPRKVVEPKRSAPQMRLQVSIPSSNAQSSSLTAGTTPQSESPETPASVTSPIAGVVDLTKSITTTSKYAVAHGGLSDIYLGEWHRTENEAEAGEKKVVVAIKLLRILARKDQDGVRARKKLNREVYVWHRLDHPNVVKLFGTSYHMSGRPAMVMQWYENGSAAEYLAKKNPNADRLQLILDVARGLAYLHTHKPPIVHADLKGNNVLITDDGRAALSDFGLSKVVEDLGRPTGYTLSNPDVGPLRWQAPEFLENDEEPAMLTSDVWSFGCTAYELLTSSIPYAHRLRDAQVIMDMQKRIKPPGPSDGELLAFDSRVRSLLDSCWSFSPTERPHMIDIQAQLEAISAS